MASVTGDTVHLRAPGVSLVVAVGGGRLPRVLHWGADLGDLDAAGLAALVVASAEPRVNGELDDRYPVAVLPEHSYGWMHTPGLTGHRDGRDHSTRFTTTRVDLADNGEGERRVERLTVEAADAVTDLALTFTIEMLASGLVRARARLASTGAGSAETRPNGEPAPYTLDALNILFPIPREATEILDFAGRWIRERVPQRGPLTVGTHLRESRRGKPGHDSAFLLAAGAPGFGFRSGEVWATHVAWSGNSRWIVERNNDGVAVLGGGELLYPGEVRLGDAYDSPWVYFTYGDGLDEASARIHRYLRSRPEHPSSPRPVIVNTWEAVYFDHDQAKLRALADAAADIGAERFVLDDGWFRHRRDDGAGLGDWYVDEGVYPDGLRPLADYVRGKGLEFGLWVEPEMINPDSDLARAHPEWIAQANIADATADPRLPLEARRQQVLDLTHPEAYDYIEERLHSLVAELQPAYLKWDHNRDLLEAGSTATGHAIGHAQTVAYYRLLDGLRAAFPGLEIESCAGGGGRIDLEVLHHVDRVWASDTNDPLERQRIQRWTGLIVPPEMMGCHIGPPTAHTTGRTHTLDFRAGTAMFGHLGIEWNVASEEVSISDDISALHNCVSLYKDYRALLHSGDVVRSDLPVPGCLLHGVVARDRSEALYAYASTDSVHENPVGLLRLPGLDPDRTYRVSPVGPRSLWETGMRARPAWWRGGVGVTETGKALANHGVQAPALHPEEVALIHVRATDAD